MRPSVPLVLMAALKKLDDMVSAEIDPAKAFDLSRLRVIVSVMQKDWDSCAADRVADIASLSDLLRRGAEISPAPLRGTLENAVEKVRRHKEDLNISKLDALLDDLALALVELQAWLEVTSIESARMLLSDVWLFLERRARRMAVMDSTW